MAWFGRGEVLGRPGRWTVGLAVLFASLAACAVGPGDSSGGIESQPVAAPLSGAQLVAVGDQPVDLTDRVISEAAAALLDPDHRIEVFRLP